MRDGRVYIEAVVSGSPPPPCVPPANDDFANAEDLPGDSGSVVGTTVCATLEVGEPDITSGGFDPDDPGNTVWYAYTPSAQGVLTLHLVESGGLRYDVEVYTGAEVTDLYGPISSYSGEASSHNITVYMTIAAQGYPAVKPYWIRVHNDTAGEEGPFTLSWDFVASPPARNLMARTSGRGRLGCGVNAAYLTWKCGAPRYCALPDSTEITYSRALNDISEATVIVTLSGSGDEECCDCLGDLEPWCHELHIARDGEVVWLGPVTEVFYDDDKVTINAIDLLGWATERVAEIELNYTDGTGTCPDNPQGPADLTTIGHEILLVAFAEDDPCAIDYISATPSGMVGSRCFPAYVDTAFDQLDSLAQTGAPEYTVVGRTIILSGADIPAEPIATLLDTHILGPVRLTKAGLLAANRWFVHYADDDTDAPPGPGVATAADQACYGLLEKVRPNDAGLVDKESAEQAAQILLGGTSVVPRLLEVPEGSQLSPEAPWTIDKMVPGARVDVSVNRLCVDATQSFRLTGVSVHQAEGDEEITVTLGPLNVNAGL